MLGSLTNGAQLRPLGDLNLHQLVRSPDPLIHTKPPLTGTQGGPLTEITENGGGSGAEATQTRSSDY